MKFIMFVMLPMFLIISQVAYAESGYRVGSVYDKPLYWENKNVPIDTLTWAQIGQQLWGINKLTAKTAAQAAIQLKPHALHVYSLQNATPISVALSIKQGYKIIVLSQWGATPKEKVLIAEPGMPQYAAQQRVVTDYQWEWIDSSRIVKGEAIDKQFDVYLYFHDAGHAVYGAKKELAFTPAQIIGKEGFVLEYDNGHRAEELTFSRMILGVYAVVDNQITTQKFVQDIEKGMDKLKLDMTYKLPSVKNLTK